MKNAVTLTAALAASLTLAGCATPPAQVLDGMQPMAVQAALERGRFELGCPSAEAMVLSRELTEPALQGPLVAGVQRGVFTIGVAGCGQRTTFQMICPEGGAGCFSAQALGGGFR